ncbi:hypothetical protein FJ366_02855 [Candidatus Dependentiae bacterium]|nr:hypothetical protein [Candidatus Dependentiae bacterium]
MARNVFLVFFILFLQVNVFSNPYSRSYVDIMRDGLNAINLQNKPFFQVKTTVSSLDFNNVKLLFRSVDSNTFIYLVLSRAQNGSAVKIIRRASAVGLSAPPDVDLQATHSPVNFNSNTVEITVRLLPTAGKHVDENMSTIPTNVSASLAVYVGNNLLFKLDSTFFCNRYSSCWGCGVPEQSYSFGGWGRGAVFPAVSWRALAPGIVSESFSRVDQRISTGDFIKLELSNSRAIGLDSQGQIALVNNSESFNQNQVFKVLSYDKANGSIRLTTLANRSLGASANKELVVSEVGNFELIHNIIEARSNLLNSTTKECLRIGSNGKLDFFAPRTGDDILSINVRKIDLPANFNQNVLTPLLNASKIQADSQSIKSSLELATLTDLERNSLVEQARGYFVEIINLLSASTSDQLQLYLVVARAILNVSGTRGLSAEQRRIFQDMIKPPFAEGDLIKIKSGDKFFGASFSDSAFNINSAYAKEAHFKVVRHDLSSNKLELLWFNNNPVVFSSNKIVAAQSGSSFAFDFVYFPRFQLGGMGVSSATQALRSLGSRLDFSLVTDDEKILDSVAFPASLSTQITEDLTSKIVPSFSRGTKQTADWEYLQSVFNSYIDRVLQLLNTSSSASDKDIQSRFDRIASLVKSIDDICAINSIPSSLKTFFQNKKNVILDSITTKISSENYGMYGWRAISSASPIILASFDAQGTTDIHVGFRDSAGGYAELVIGGWGNTQSAIRYFTPRSSTSHQLSDEIVVPHATPPISSTTTFLKYLVVLNNRRLIVSVGDTVIISRDVPFFQNKSFNAYSFRNVGSFQWSLRYPSVGSQNNLNLAEPALDVDRVINDFNGVFITALKSSNRTDLEKLHIINQALRYKEAVEKMFDFTAQAERSTRVKDELAAGFSSIMALPGLSTNLQSHLSEVEGALKLGIAQLKINDVVRILFNNGDALCIIQNSNQLGGVKSSSFDTMTQFKVVSYDVAASKISFAATRQAASGLIVSNGRIMLTASGNNSQIFDLIYDQKTGKSRLKVGNAFVGQVISQGTSSVVVAADVSGANSLLTIERLPNVRHIFRDINSAAQTNTIQLNSADVTKMINEIILPAFNVSPKDPEGRDWQYVYDQFNTYATRVRNSLNFQAAAAESIACANILVEACTRIAGIAGLPKSISDLIVQMRTTISSLRPAQDPIKANDVIKIKQANNSYLYFNGRDFDWRAISELDLGSMFRVEEYDTNTRSVKLRTFGGRSITQNSSLLAVGDAQASSASFSLEFNQTSLKASFRSGDKYLAVRPSFRPGFDVNTSTTNALFDLVVTSSQDRIFSTIKIQNITMDDVKRDVDTFVRLFELANKTTLDWSYIATQFNSYVETILALNIVKDNLLNNVAGLNLRYYEYLNRAVKSFSDAVPALVSRSFVEEIVRKIQRSVSPVQLLLNSLAKKDQITENLIAADFKDKIIPAFALLVDRNSEWTLFVTSLKNYVTDLKSKNEALLDTKISDSMTVKSYVISLCALISSPLSVAQDQVKKLARQLSVDVGGGVKLFDEKDFYLFDFASTGTFILRAVRDSGSVVLSGPEFIMSANNTRYTKSAHYTINSYDRAQKLLTFSIGIIRGIKARLEPVERNGRLFFAFKDANNNYLTLEPLVPGRNQGFSFISKDAKDLFSITIADPLEVHFDSLINPSNVLDLQRMGDLFLQGFGLLTNKPEDVEFVYMIFETFLNEVIKSSLWGGANADNFDVKNYLRHLTLVFLAQPCVTRIIRDKLLFLLSQNKPQQEAKKTVVVEKKQLNYSLPDGNLADIPSDIILFANAFESAKESTSDLAAILANCLSYAQKASLRLDWVYSDDISKQAHRVAFIAALNKLLQQNLASYYSGLNQDLRQKIRELLVVAGNDKPTYSLQVDKLDDIARRITKADELIELSPLLILLRRLSPQIAADGGDDLQKKLIQKIDSYFLKQNIPALGVVPSSDTRTVFAWKNMICDRLIEAFGIEGFSSSNIAVRVSWMKEILNVRLASSIFTAQEKRDIGKKLADSILVKAAPLVKNASRAVKDLFRDVLLIFDQHAPAAVEGLWRSASISKIVVNIQDQNSGRGAGVQGNNRGGGV